MFPSNLTALEYICFFGDRNSKVGRRFKLVKMTVKHPEQRATEYDQGEDLIIG